MYLTLLFFVVYAGFIGWFSFFITPATCRWNGARIAQRNPEWLCAQPVLAERLRRRTLPVLASRLVGVALLVALGFAALAGEPLEAMTVVLITSIVTATVFIFFEAWSYWRLSRRVPAPAKREADLGSTRHEDHMPMPWARYWYVALSAALALYALAYVAGLVPAGQAIARMIGIGLIIVVSWFSYRQARKYPAQPGQRKFGIAVMAFCLLVVAGRIAQDFFDAPQVNEIWFWFFFAVAMQVVFLISTVRWIRQAKAAPSKSAAAL